MSRSNNDHVQRAGRAWNALRLERNLGGLVSWRWSVFVFSKNFIIIDWLISTNGFL